MGIEEAESRQKRIIRANRDPVPAGNDGIVINIPAKVNKFLCKNSGDVPIRINFNGQPRPQHWELAPGESLPVAIDISDKTTMTARAVGGAGEIQCILWS